MFFPSILMFWAKILRWLAVLSLNPYLVLTWESQKSNVFFYDWKISCAEAAYGLLEMTRTLFGHALAFDVFRQRFTRMMSQARR